jgi:hypothetical protein
MIFIHESDTISGLLEGFHCSSIDSIVEGECWCCAKSSGIVVKVVVLMMIRDPEKPKSI